MTDEQATALVAEAGRIKRARQDAAAVKAFSMSYPEELASTYDRVTIAIANSFQPAVTDVATEAGR